MIIDNFNIISRLLDFSSSDIFYDLEIIRRGKDHPELKGCANRQIKTYCICKLEDLEHFKDEIIKICSVCGARAYINVSPKSLQKTLLIQLSDLALRNLNKDYKCVWRSWNSAVGKNKGEVTRWVVDIDEKNEDKVKEVGDFINSLQPFEITNKIVAKIPTLNGFHLITTAFRVDEFKRKFSEIDIQKNHLTLLYYEKI